MRKLGRAIFKDKRYAGLFAVLLSLVILLHVASYLNDGVSYETFLGTIGQGLMTVLAIIFALIMFPIQHASERYTVEMLKEFKRDLYTKVLFALISISALSSLFMLGLYKHHSSPLTAVMFASTFLCLFSLYHFYYHVIDLLDPRVLIHKISRRVSSYIKTTKTSNPDAPNAESIIAQLNIPEQVVLKSIERNETDIIVDTIRELNRLCYLVSGRKRDVVSEQIFRRILNLYTRALLQALKFDNNSKYLLIYFVRDLVFLRPDKTPFNKEYLDTLIRYLYRANQLIINFDDMELFKAQLDYFSTHVDRDKVVERELYDVFFMIGVHALQSEGKERFVKAIWTNINKGDTPVKIVGSKNLVNFDVGFLCEQEVRLSESDKYIFDIMKGFGPYITKYFVLCLTYALHTLKHTWDIAIPEDNEQKRSLYILLSSLKRRTAEYKKRCEELKAEANKWSDVIKPETVSAAMDVAGGTMPSAKLGFREIGTEEAFENTKKWIDKMEVEWNNKMQILIEALPLDPEKVDRCETEITRTYAEDTILPEVVNLRTYEEEKDKSLELRSIGLGYLVDREWFTSPTHIPMFSDMGRSIALGEENYLIKQMIEFGETKYIERFDFDALKSAITEFKESGYQPTSLFAPIDYYVELHGWQRSHENKGLRAIEYAERRPYFVINSETKLRIFWSSKYVKFEDFIVVDRKFGEWIVKPDESGNLLTISIRESKKEPRKVDVLVKTSFNFKIVDPKAVRILRKRH
jgi:hypothetical protein